MRRFALLAALLALGVMGQRFGPIADAGAGRTLLYSEDFQGVGRPAEWTDASGTPDYDFTDLTGEALRVVGDGVGNVHAQLDSAWAATQTLKCYEFDVKLGATTESGVQFVRARGPGISTFMWRFATTGTTGSVLPTCGNATGAQQNFSLNTAVAIEWELDVLNGDCRIRYDATTEVTIDGTAEGPTDAFTGLDFQTQDLSTSRDFRIDNIEVYDGACQF